MFLRVSIIVIIFFALSSCSLFSKKSKTELDSLLVGHTDVSLDDYESHLNFLGRIYRESKSKNISRLSRESKNYLNYVASEIYLRNELFFKNSESPLFFVVEDPRPFYFSLPDKSIHLSTGLIKKYIKSEKILYCLIAFELIRNEKRLYKKVRIVPTGSLDTSKMLSLLRLGVKVKVEVHKWSYYLLKRLGIDSGNYLSWLQIQNRNSIDFSMQLGEISSISREESQFKSFIIRNIGRKRSSLKYERSSKGFYQFINSIRG